jgi:hypothetical protein
LKRVGAQQKGQQESKVEDVTSPDDLENGETLGQVLAQGIHQAEQNNGGQ